MWKGALTESRDTQTRHTNAGLNHGLNFCGDSTQETKKSEDERDHHATGRSDNDSYCQLEIKSLNGTKTLLEDVSVDSTIAALYERVNVLERQSSKWKLAIVVHASLRTLKWAEGESPLRDFGVQADQQYRVEVILDMGACHGGSGRR